MAWIIPQLSTVGFVNLALGVDDDLFVAAGVTVASATYRAVDVAGGDTRMIVRGTLVGAPGVSVFETVGASLTVGATGRVTGHSGVAFDGIGSGTAIVNHGVMESLTDTMGLIGVRGMENSAAPASVVNAGLIEGAFGVHLGADVAEFRLINGGTIRTTDIAFSDEVAGGVTTVVNAGLFQGSTGRLVGDLLGGDGDDRLLTGQGSQIPFGGAGDDVTMGGADPLDGGAGIDTAAYATASRDVRADLDLAGTNAGDTYAGIERLAGSAFADVLPGGAGRNTVLSGAGADVVRGRGGNDVLAGGAGADRVVFDTAPGAGTNVDRILDFRTDVDTIVLDNAVFTTLALGPLTLGVFRASAAGLAADAGDRILYETDTGFLSYDRDGTGAAAAVRSAQVGLGLGMGADDFVVI